MADSASRRWLGLVFISIAVSLIIVDSTIVNVAIPSIVDDLGITSTEVQWVQEAYTLVFASLLLVFGSLADRFGRRRMLIIGVVVFALSSVAAALATSGGILILARLVQGVGGAMVLPSTLSLINATFRGRERGIAFAVWGSTIGGMAALGPLLGGWLTTYFSWRWAFGINVPLGIIIIVGVLFTVAESRDDKVQRIDVVGAILSVITCAALVFALIEGRSYGWWQTDTAPSIGGWTWPWDISPIPFAFLTAILGLVAFVAWGRHRVRIGKPALLPFELFAIASFRNGNIAAMIVALGEFGIILSLPLWLQFVIGYSALQTGFVLLGLAIGSFVASGFAGVFSNRISPLLIVRIGLVAEIIGVAGLAFVIGTDTEWTVIVPMLFVYGFGVGLATAQLTGVVLSEVPVRSSGQGSGTQSTARQVGSALGIAILGTVLFTVTAGVLGAKLDDRSLSAAERDKVVTSVVDSAGGAIAGLAASEQSAPFAEDAKEAFSQGTRAAAFTAAGFLSLGFIATLTLGPARRRDGVEEEARTAQES